MNVLVTGANGFVGVAAVSRFARENEASTPLEEFRRVNTEGSINLARQAAASGARRLVFVSSLKVNGDEGFFTELDASNPNGAYAVSKYKAEIGIRRVADQTGLELTIIRPPLVYGPGVRANFRLLMNAVESGVPLPLASVRNRRSLVALGNLADFVVTCTKHPAARGEVFFVSDDEDVSTPELIRRLARAMGRPARLWPVPPALLNGAASAFGKRDFAQPLFKSLRIDISKARRTLGWAPPLGLDQGLALVVSGEQ